MAAGLGQRIMILGAGSGKSTLARVLGRCLELPVHHLDRVFWRPGWIETPRAVFDAELAALASGPRWIIDGNYLRTVELRLRRADTVIGLDLPRRVCLARAIRRMLRDYGRTRADMPPGCPEHVDPAFLAWIWNFPRHTRPHIIALLDRPGDRGGLPVPGRLRTRREVEPLLAEARA